MQEKRFQNGISILTFALTILVIWVHSVNLGDIPPAAGARSEFFYGTALLIERFLTNTIGQIAVPGFFLVSAYLFFRSGESGIHANGFWSWILMKWKRRVFSVLLPFLVWNLLYYLAHLIPARLSVYLNMPFWEQVPSDAGTVINALFEYSYNPVFWYLQQLILLIIFAPAVYLFLRKRVCGTAVLLLSFLAAVYWERVPVHIINEDALFYYLLGAYAALHLKDRIENGSGFVRILFVAAFLWAAAAAVQYISAEYGGTKPGVPILARTILFRALAPVTLYFLLMFSGKACKNPGSFLERDKLPGFMKINFFIYATHYAVVRAVNTCASYLTSADGVLRPAETAALLCLYLILPVLCTATAYGISLPLKRFVPGVWRVLSGGR